MHLNGGACQANISDHDSCSGPSHRKANNLRFLRTTLTVGQAFAYTCWMSPALGHRTCSSSASSSWCQGSEIQGVAAPLGAKRHRRPASLPHHAYSAGECLYTVLGRLLHRGQVDRAS